MKQKKLLYVVPIALLCGMSACTEDIDFNQVSKDIQHNISLIVPIGVAEATIEQVIDNLNSDDVLKDVENNTCYMHFEDSMVINDTVSRFNHGGTINKTYYVKNDPNCPEIGKRVPSDTQFTLTQILEYDFDYDEIIGGSLQQRVDSLVIAQATVNASFALSDLPLGGSQVVAWISFPEIPELKDFSMYVVLKDGETSNVSKVIDTPFKIRFAQGGNVIKMKIDYKFVAGSNLILQTSSKIYSTTKIDGIDFSKAWGYFGKPDQFTHDDKVVPIPSGIFTRPVFANNNLLFHDPEITFNFKSNVGVPLNFEVEEIKAVDANGVEKYADFNGHKNYVMPLDEAPYEGGVSSNSFLFNRANGGTHQLFQIKPEKFAYKFNVKVRQKEGVNHHFWFRPTNVDVKFFVKMPFVFDLGSQFAYTDTLAANLREVLGQDTIPSKAVINLIKIKFANTNNLPCKAILNVQLLDGSDNILYKRDGVTIDAGTINSEGLVTSPTQSNFSLDFTGDEVYSIMNMKKVVLVSYLQAEDHPNQKLHFRLSDSLTSRVSVFAQGGIDTSK
ncbi:MAG: hypothetical protein EOM76_00575 [Sphingobacteriia bacterium]|nr:hypothetical protein [Sphingobacteriia bacterium]